MSQSSLSMQLRWSFLLAGAALVAVPAWAMPPPPPNDTPATAEVIGPDIPLLVQGTTVLAANDVTATPGVPEISQYVDGPDVFYRFTPAATGSYRIHLHPWQEAPLRSSDRRFVLYIMDAAEESIFAGVRAPGDARQVQLDVALDGGLEYIIGVDHDDTAHDNFDFTLIVDTLAAVAPDTCDSAEVLEGTLPIATLGNIDGAAADFTFTAGTGLCSVATSTTAPGNDHVYYFTPPADDAYAFELVTNGFDGVLYINTSCPPVFPEGCLGASNHATGGTSGARHELIVVGLLAGVQYAVYVDNSSTSSSTGQYALIIDTADAYEINEKEINDTPAAALPLETPLNGGQLAGPLDEDWWAVPGLTGDRVYAWVNNGGSTNSTLDTNLGFYAPDGATLLEFDDEDADGADAPIEDLRFIYSTSAAVIAGARLVADGNHYLRVTDASDTGTVHRYRLHTGVEPGTRAPLAECEPNDTEDLTDFTGKHYYAGVIDSTADLDFYAFDAEVGDRVFIAFDGDPERDATGSTPANEDPNAFHGKLVIYDPEGDVLISDISDANNVNNPPDYPAQGGFFVVRSSGKHYVQVGPQSSSSQVGPTETYELAIFLNESAPALSEDVDPLLTLTPNYGSDTVPGTASDDGSGVCSVTLVAPTNVQIANLGALPAPVVTFDVVLIDPGQSGFAKVLVTDCAGNTACEVVRIDVLPPVCSGSNFAVRQPRSTHGPLFIPDNEPSGPGIISELEIPDTGLVTDVDVTVTFETTSVSDLDIYLISPLGTTVELVTDRGSSFAFNLTDATFDDEAEETLSILSSDEPYTGRWKPEGVLATLDGQSAQGTWKLQVWDDSSSENGGSRLVRWSLAVEGTFAGPEILAATATDFGGFDAGIASIELTDALNVQLNLPQEFAPGATSVDYTVTLINPALDGSGTLVVTDLQENTCEQEVALAGLPDVTAPETSGGPTTSIVVTQEIQADIPPAVPSGVVVPIPVDPATLVGEVEFELTVDTQDLGRLAATLAHDGEFAALLNRVGMDERASVGLTKNTIWVMLDDDAPQADDAHLEPASGAVPFLGLHQPDGRGGFVGDGITTDPRDNMLLNLAGLTSDGTWELMVGDYRQIGSTRSELRRAVLTIKSPCGAERFQGTARDLDPGSGIVSVALADGADNLVLYVDFTAPADEVDYRIELLDPYLPGTGTLEITDGGGNVAGVPVALNPAAADQSPPLISAAVNPATHEFEGLASDLLAGDSGIVSVELAPYAHNLQLLAVTPDPPAGAAEVVFTVGLIDPLANGRGYVRVTDGCGWRGHMLVEIDALAPVCTGAVGNTKRYVSTDGPLDIPDNTPGGIVSLITVPDEGTISDVDITLNIVHAFDDDLDLTVLAPVSFLLFDDIGSTGNDFVDTVFDDEAAAPIPDTDAEAPFTGSYQPEAGPILTQLDGLPAAGLFSLRIVDDKSNDTGTFLNWAVTITSEDFAERFDGRAEDAAEFDLGICTIELLDGAVNLSLETDPFAPGDRIVRYSVALTNPGPSGSGTVRVTDCGGNYCDVPVTLAGAGFPLGDLNCDGVLNAFDIDPFILALTDEAAYAVAYPDCDILLADLNGDGVVNAFDIDPFIEVLTPG